MRLVWRKGNRKRENAENGQLEKKMGKNEMK